MNPSDPVIARIIFRCSHCGADFEREDVMEKPRLIGFRHAVESYIARNFFLIPQNVPHICDSKTVGFSQAVGVRYYDDKN